MMSGICKLSMHHNDSLWLMARFCSESCQKLPIPSCNRLTRSSNWVGFTLPTQSNGLSGYKGLKDSASALISRDKEAQVSTFLYVMGEKSEDIMTTFNLTEEDAKKYDRITEKFKNHFICGRDLWAI